MNPENLTTREIIKIEYASSLDEDSTPSKKFRSFINVHS